MAPGINALKTFDPPLHALEGRAVADVRRVGGKNLAVDVAGDLHVLLHLMSAGRFQLYDKRASLRDRTSRLLLRLADGRELRLREFGKKQAAWVKVLRPEDLMADEAIAKLGPDAWPDPPEDLRELLVLRPPAALGPARPARDHRDRPLVGRRDPLDRPPVAVQARRRPRRGGGRHAAHRDRRHARRARSSTTSASSSCRSPTSSRCPSRSTATTASRARAAARRSRRSTTRTTSCVTARRSRPAAASSRIAACRAC